MVEALSPESIERAKREFTPSPEPTAVSMNNDWKLDVPAYLAKYGYEMVGTKPHGSSTLYCLKQCVFDDSHTSNESAIGQAVDGKLFYQCFHNSCEGHTWHEARKIISGDDPLREKNYSIPIISNTKKNKINLSNVYDSSRMVEEYEGYIESLKNNQFITGIGEIDKRIRGVAGGEVLDIIARAGAFKTAMLQNLLKNYMDNSAWGAAYFSIEMPVASLAERYFGILDGCTGQEVEDMFKKKDTVRAASIKQFEDDLKKLFIIPTRVSIDDIPKYVKLIEENFNIKIGVVGIDYMGLINGRGSSVYERISTIATDTKIMAKEINLPVIVLGQVSRKGGDGQTEIQLDMARDSGVIEEGADFVLGLWKLWEDDEKHLICKILKNRKGEENSCWKLSVYPKTLHISGNAERYEPKKTKKNISI